MMGGVCAVWSVCGAVCVVCVCDVVHLCVW